jgi:hypothetical protein
MLTETLRILFSVIGRWFSIANLSLAAGKMCKNQFVTGRFRYDFTESQSASCQQFQCQNRRFRVFEEETNEKKTNLH